jgi:hypothetical protein
MQLDQLNQLQPRERIGPFASTDLLAGIRQFIDRAPGPSHAGDRIVAVDGSRSR